MRERLIHWLKQRDQSQSYDWLDKWETCLVGEFLRDHQIKFSDFVATDGYEQFKKLFRSKPWTVGAALERLLR